MCLKKHTHNYSDTKTILYELRPSKRSNTDRPFTITILLSRNSTCFSSNERLWLLEGFFAHLQKALKI